MYHVSFLLLVFALYSNMNLKDLSNRDVPLQWFYCIKLLQSSTQTLLFSFEFELLWLLIVMYLLVIWPTEVPVILWVLSHEEGECVLHGWHKGNVLPQDCTHSASHWASPTPFDPLTTINTQKNLNCMNMWMDALYIKSKRHRQSRF